MGKQLRVDKAAWHTKYRQAGEQHAGKWRVNRQGPEGTRAEVMWVAGKRPAETSRHFAAERAADAG